MQRTRQTQLAEITRASVRVVQRADTRVRLPSDYTRVYRLIGRALFVAEGTVKNHVSNILTKLAVRDRTRAVLKALELGYV